VEVVALGSRACALFNDGTAQCWGGFNLFGQLGLGDTRLHKTPGWVLGLKDAASLVLSANRTCALTKQHALFCWGLPLPDPGLSRKVVSRATKIDGVLKPVAVALGEHHACVAEATGEVLCWGTNRDGQLGLGSQLTEAAAPQKVEGLPEIDGLAADGQVTVAWARDGRLFVWGRPDGVEPKLDFKRPHEVKGLSRVKRAKISSDHVCALLHDGEVRCFTHPTLADLAAGKQHNFESETRALGQALQKVGLLKSSKSRKSKPWVGSWLFPDGRGISDVVDLAVFNKNATAVTAAGEVFSWGDPKRGTVGHPPGSRGFVGPTKIRGLSGAVSVVGGFMHRCVLDSAGAVSCFGEGRPGVLGTAERRNAIEAVKVEGLPRIMALASNDNCVFGLAEDGVLYACGANALAGSTQATSRRQVLSPYRCSRAPSKHDANALSSSLCLSQRPSPLSRSIAM
jgi:alpha-tubulin suppressor-like RCC1 family protein